MADLPLIEVVSAEQLVGLSFDVEEDLYRGHKNQNPGCEIIALENIDDVPFAELEETTDLFVLYGQQREGRESSTT